MTPDARPPCTCTATGKPCPSCLTWEEWPRTRRGRPRAAVIPVAELRLRGLTHHYEPAATTALFVPLAPLEVTWLSL